MVKVVRGSVRAATRSIDDDIELGLLAAQWWEAFGFDPKTYRGTSSDGVLIRDTVVNGERTRREARVIYRDLFSGLACIRPLDPETGEPLFEGDIT